MPTNINPKLGCSADTGDLLAQRKRDIIIQVNAQDATDGNKVIDVDILLYIKAHIFLLINYKWMLKM